MLTDLDLVPILLGWLVGLGPISLTAIHEDMTRAAANMFDPADVPFLVDGVRRPDVGGSLEDHVNPDEQKRHALRRGVWSSNPEALSEAVAHLGQLHRAAIAHQSREERLRLFGEALHLIQDSFSPAHAERTGYRYAVRKLRFYGQANHQLDDQEEEHGFPGDLRDYGREWPTGKFTREASNAILASRDYLRMALRHTRAPRPVDSVVERDLRGYVFGWLSD